MCTCDHNESFLKCLECGFVDKECEFYGKSGEEIICCPKCKSERTAPTNPPKKILQIAEK